MAAAAASDTAPPPPKPLPREVLLRIFSLLPRGERNVTPGRVCREWAAVTAEARAAAAGAHAKEPYPWLPLWYVRGMRPVSWLALKGALYHGQVDVLDFLYLKYNSAFMYTCTPAVFYAAEGGSMEALEWLRARGFELQGGARTCMAAAAGGHLAALRSLRDHKCRWNHEMCTAAAKGGHMEVVRWARENRCKTSRETCAALAAGGQLEALKFLHETGCWWDLRTTKAAEEHGHTAVLEWAIANGCPYEP